MYTPHGLFEDTHSAYGRIFVKSSTFLIGSNHSSTVKEALCICRRISQISSRSYIHCLATDPAFQVYIHIFSLTDDINPCPQLFFKICFYIGENKKIRLI